MVVTKQIRDKWYTGPGFFNRIPLSIAFRIPQYIPLNCCKRHEFDMSSHHLWYPAGGGCLSNNDGGGNKNVKIAKGRYNARNHNSSRTSHILIHFFAVTAGPQREIFLTSRFIKNSGVKHKATIFFFLSLVTFHKNPTPGKFPTFDTINGRFKVYRERRGET